MRFKLLFIILSCVFISNVSLALEEVQLENFSEPEIIYSKKPEKLEGSLFIDSAEKAQLIITKQQETDIKDLENLWNATVEKNPIIKFSLAKLAIPEEQRRVHSSLMAKSLSALISGASMLPSFMGANYAIQTASYTGARLVNNLINKDNIKKMNKSPLTDTEMIELATLIEELQDDIVSNYYGYKGSLIRLKEIRSDLIKYNENYSKALQTDDVLEIAVSSALWDMERAKELEVVEDVKKYQIVLERLAGADVVGKLELIQYNIDTRNVDVKDLNIENKNLNSGVKK